MTGTGGVMASLLRTLLTTCCHWRAWVEAEYSRRLLSTLRSRLSTSAPRMPSMAQAGAVRMGRQTSLDELGQSGPRCSSAAHGLNFGHDHDGRVRVVREGNCRTDYQGAGVSEGTRAAALGSGTGKTGTYTVSISQTVPKETMETGGTISDTCCNSFSEANQIMTISNSGSMIQAAAMVAVLGGR